MFQLQSALHHEMDTGISATTTLAEQTGKPELVGAVNPSGGYVRMSERLLYYPDQCIV